VPTGIEYLDLLEARRAAELDGQRIGYRAISEDDDQPDEEQPDEEEETER
jgi:hypothetical protein